MNIFKKIKLYNSFSTIINNNRVDIKDKLNMRIDRANRLYTVLNIPQEAVGVEYDLNKRDIDRIAEGYLKKYITDVRTYLNSIGLVELYDFYEPIEKVDKYSYKIVIGYKNLNSVDVSKILYGVLIPLVSITVITTIIVGITKIFY